MLGRSRWLAGLAWPMISGLVRFFLTIMLERWPRSFVRRHPPGMGVYQWAEHLAVSHVPWRDRYRRDQLTISVNAHMLFAVRQAHRPVFDPEAQTRREPRRRVAVEALRFAFAPEAGVRIGRARHLGNRSVRWQRRQAKQVSLSLQVGSINDLQPVAYQSVLTGLGDGLIENLLKLLRPQPTAVRQAHGPVFDPEAQTRRERHRRAEAAMARRRLAGQVEIDLICDLPVGQAVEKLWFDVAHHSELVEEQEYYLKQDQRIPRGPPVVRAVAITD